MNRKAAEKRNIQMQKKRTFKRKVKRNNQRKMKTRIKNRRRESQTECAKDQTDMEIICY